MSKEAEAIQRLLIDRSLGELEPDVEVILEAYLALTPRMQQETIDIDMLISQARVAIRPAPMTNSADPPPPSFLSSDHPTRKTAVSWTWINYIAAAAVIVLAIRIGLNNPPNKIEPRQPHRVLTVRPMSHPSSAGFWSLSRFQQNRSSQQTRNRRPIKWPGPLTWPQLGEQS